MFSVDMAIDQTGYQDDEAFEADLENQMDLFEDDDQYLSFPSFSHIFTES